MLDVDRVTCDYEDSVVLRNLSVEAHVGEVLALIGPNGAGKTTLLRAMARLLEPRAGTVQLAERDVWTLSPRAVARRLGVAPQNEAAAWPITVEEAVALGRAPHRGWLLPLSDEDDAAIERALAQTGLTNMRRRQVDELSGGEQRRVVLARVLAQEPAVLLLDEPTVHLDLKYQTEIMELVHQLAHVEALTVVVSLHDLNLAALYADRLALLHDGSLLAVGSPPVVLTREHLHRAYDVPVVVTQHPLAGTPLVMPAVNGFREEDECEAS